MSPRVTNQVPPVHPPPSPQVLPLRLHHPPQNPRSHPAKGRVLTRPRCPSHRRQLKRRKAGSRHCHPHQAAGSPRYERPRAVLRRRSELPRIGGRNRQEEGRGQVGEREAEEAFQTRSRGLRDSLSSKLSLCRLRVRTHGPSIEIALFDKFSTMQNRFT